VFTSLWACSEQERRRTWRQLRTGLRGPPGEASAAGFGFRGVDRTGVLPGLERGLEFMVRIGAAP
jgi:hypothetical protein